MTLLELVKRAGIGAMEASSPTAALLGQVLTVQPLTVLVDQRFTLPEEFLLVPESLRERRVDIGGEQLILNRGLEANDSVLLLRVQGGQQYIVLDRMVIG